MQEQQPNPPIEQMIDKKTTLFGYIAAMATTSKLPRAFSKYCLAEGENASMVGLNIREDDLLFTLNGLKSSQIKGVLIGEEYAKEALGAMDHITKEAEISGFIDACVVQGGKLIGHIAMGQAMATLCKVGIHKRLAIFGSGSLARSLVLNLDERGFDEIVLFVDRVESAMELIEAVAPFVSKLRFDIERATPGSVIDLAHFDGMVNASHGGKFAHDKVIALENAKDKFLMDSAYSKMAAPSLFESIAKANEAIYIGGYDIISKAAKTHYKVWFEKEPKNENMHIERG